MYLHLHLKINVCFCEINTFCSKSEDEFHLRLHGTNVKLVRESGRRKTFEGALVKLRS